MQKLLKELIEEQETAIAIKSRLADTPAKETRNLLRLGKKRILLYFTNKTGTASK